MGLQPRRETVWHHVALWCFLLWSDCRLLPPPPTPQPLYGLLQAKLQLITHAYFEEKDFSQISILKVGVGTPWWVSAVLASACQHTVTCFPVGIFLIYFLYFSPSLTAQELYEHMNGSLPGTVPEGSQVYLGKTPTQRPLLGTTGSCSWVCGTHTLSSCSYWVGFDPREFPTIES